jgi:hypothetical protein
LTAKIHMLAETFGRPLRFRITPDRQTVHFEGFVHLGAAMIWLR